MYEGVFATNNPGCFWHLGIEPTGWRFYFRIDEDELRYCCAKFHLYSPGRTRIWWNLHVSTTSGAKRAVSELISSARMAGFDPPDAGSIIGLIPEDFVETHIVSCRQTDERG